MKLLRHIKAAIRGYGSSQSGVTAPIVAIMFTGLVGLAGYAIDMGHVAWVQRQLQASADAAALAGGLYVGTNDTAAASTAVTYSGLAGNNNAIKGASSVTMVGGAPTIKCLSSSSVVPACGDTTTGNNAIVVTETATVPTYFLKIFRVNNFTLTAKATASAKGGQGEALNVMVVLDTTPSMSSADTNCTNEVPDPNHAGRFLSSPTKMQCAQAGAAALLVGLNAQNSKIGFMTFPPVNSAGKTADTTCGGSLSGSDIVSYKNATGAGTSSQYLLSDLTNSFSATTSATKVLVGQGTPSSGHATCTGVQAEPGSGGQYTFFADAITAAQAALAARGSPGAQNVIVLLSDGDANSPAANVPANEGSGQCRLAIANAQTAAGTGTWIYTVAYGSNSAAAFSSTPNANATITNNIQTNTVTVTNPTVTDAPVTTGSGNGTRISTTSHVTSTTSNGGCSTDTANPISPCTTMAGMASDSTKFYSDGTSSSNTTTNQTVNTTTITNGQGSKNGINQPQPTTTVNSPPSTTTATCTGTGGNSADIVALFKEISSTLTQPRLIPNSTT